LPGPIRESSGGDENTAVSLGDLERTDEGLNLWTLHCVFLAVPLGLDAN